MRKDHSTCKNNKYRVLVIGLDGATFDYISPWIAEGTLPTFKALIETGFTAPLVSTILSVTPPAWTSLATGTNPGKHGQFYFHDLKALPDQLILCNSTNRQSLAIWNILTEIGKTCVIQNLPMTYPPEEINGAMITGFLTPPGVKDNAHPPNLHAELMNMGYQIGPIFGGDEKPTIHEIEKIIQKRTETAKWLMKKYDWDFFLVVYMATDGVVHKYPKEPEIIRRVYEIIDDAIKVLIETIPKNTIVFLVSDHGTGVIYQNFFLNNWLRNNGFLQIKSSTRQTRGKSSFLPKLLKFLGSFRLTRALLRRIPIYFRRRVVSQIVPKRTDIDRNHSQAWCPAATRNFAYIDVQPPKEEDSHEYNHLVTALISKLKSATIPQSGKRFVKAVHKTDEIMWGSALSLAPPLILETDEDCNISFNFTYDRQTFRIDPSDPVPTHKRNGILIANGPGIKSDGSIKILPNIWDVMPTILHILNVHPPHDLDGQVLKEIFTANSDFAKRKQLDPRKYAQKIHKQKGLTAQEQEEVADRLRQLGYL